MAYIQFIYVANFLSDNEAWSALKQESRGSQNHNLVSRMAAQSAADGFHSLTSCRLACSADLIVLLWASDLNEKDFKSWQY